MHEAEERAMRDTLDTLENMVAQLDAMNALLKSQLDQIRRLKSQRRP
jgi:flagellar capping protein FliD